MLPSDKLEVVSQKEHYKELEREFDTSHWWIFVLNGLVTIGCFIAFLLIDGKELVYSLYIPLDLFLNICKFGFYHYYYYESQV